MNKESKKGFTLIELLIVIAIIGILAVAFLPTLLGGPARGRDAARVSDLQSIHTAIISHLYLAGETLPEVDGLARAELDDVNEIVAELGGTIPRDPSWEQNYYYRYVSAPAGFEVGTITYSLGLVAFLEGPDNANAGCGDNPNLVEGASLNWEAIDFDAAEEERNCYVILER